MDVIEKIRKYCCYFGENEDMSKHTTIGCGGRARFYCEVDTIGKLCKVLRLCQDVLPVFLLGNGSNCIFLNFGGLVVCTRRLNKIKVRGEKIYCQCGTNLVNLCLFAKNHNLGGLEFCYGIPATVGGACSMNAGAFGGEFGDVVQKVWVYDKRKKKLLRKNLSFFYRDSSIKQNNQIVLAVEIGLKTAKVVDIDQKMTQIMQKRKSTQPLQRSAGSVFKRDGEVIPAKIIDKLGLKGVKINGAMVSDKHAGFIVNASDATAWDVVRLIELVKSKVKNECDIDLKQEVEIIGG